MSSDSSAKESLASTACWVAAVRAHERERADRLFDDPWAALLAGQAGQAWLDRMARLEGQIEHMSKDCRISMHWGEPGQEWGHPRLRIETAIPEKPANIFTRNQETPTEIGMIIRTRFFDDFLLQATREHEIRQVVILAAGMDTRAFRLTWPIHTRLFEVDQPELLLHKKQLLLSAGASLTCSRWSIGVDLLQRPWPATLIRAGFDPHQTSIWLIEGFLPYLSESAALALLDKVMALSAPGSCLGLTAINREMLASPVMRFWLKSMKESGVPCLSAMDEPEALLAKRGWAATVVQLGEESANFGRWPHPVVARSVPNIPRGWLVTAIKRSLG